MHLTEALMAAFEATGDKTYLEMAESIATLVIDRLAAAHGWRVAEHFDENWKLDRDYANGDVFRPYGTTPGHSLEWTRLLLQLWELGGRRLGWLPDAAKALFARAVGGRLGRGAGRLSTTRSTGTASRASRTASGGRARKGSARRAFLNAIDGAPEYEDWYRRIWDFVASHLIDRENGGWRPEPRDPSRQAGLVRGQARPLSRAAGVPHPAPADDRLDHARAHDGRPEMSEFRRQGGDRHRRRHGDRRCCRGASCRARGDARASSIATALASKSWPCALRAAGAEVEPIVGDLRELKVLEHAVERTSAASAGSTCSATMPACSDTERWRRRATRSGTRSTRSI